MRLRDLFVQRMTKSQLAFVVCITFIVLEFIQVEYETYFFLALRRYPPNFKSNTVTKKKTCTSMILSDRRSKDLETFVVGFSLRKKIKRHRGVI